MNYLFNILIIGCLATISCANTNLSENLIPKSTNTETEVVNGNYTLVVEGYDWGAAACKVILSGVEGTTSATAANFKVIVNKSTPCADLKPEEATGELKVMYTYHSDAEGNRDAAGTHLTLALYVAPFEQMNSPIKYFFGNPKCNGNNWIDFKLTITNDATQQTWNNETNRIIPMVDEFDLSGSFSHKEIDLTYASFAPKSTIGKRPLIIWLHGGGEGGTDITIPLLANRATNYASQEMQAYFEGAHVLVPQAPTMWMDKGNRQYTRGEVNDIYNESLMALIENYVSRHPSIDQNRIYVGGCSNGGYMSLKLLLLYPNYFAAAFPSALAYHAEHLTDADIESIKDIPIWFIHSKDDPVTVANQTVIPTYQRLIDAGAKNVHLSLFDHVIDITNQFGGEDFHYNGHFSWIYSHANKCQLDYDGNPVKADEQPVTLMGWLARQTRSER